MTLLAGGTGGPGPDVSIVIPCLDEAANALDYERTLLAPLEKEPFGAEIIFSDGGSTDGTADILSGLAAGRSGLTFLRAEKPSSFAESIARALPSCRGRYICLLEADLSFSPADVGRLLSEARSGNCDCVCGSPFLGGFEGLGAFRLFLTRSANLLLRLRFGRAVTSYTQIFKLFRADKLRGLGFDSAGFSIDAELTAKCLGRGFKVSEVPVTMRARTRDISKLKPGTEILACLRLMLRGVAEPAPARTL